MKAKKSGLKLGVMACLMALTTQAMQAQTATQWADEAQKSEKAGNDSVALSQLFKARQLMQSQGDTATADYGKCLHNIGRLYLNKGNFTLGRAYTLQGLNIRKRIYGEKSREYISSLNNYALSFSMENHYDKAIELQRKVCQLIDGMKKKETEYGGFYMNLGDMYNMVKQKSEAVIYWEKALPLITPNGKRYENLLEKLAYTYDELNDQSNYNRIFQLMEDYNAEELKKDCDEPDCLLERAQYYSAKNDNENARTNFLLLLKKQLTPAQRAEAYKAYALFLGTNLRDFKAGSEYFTLGVAAYREAYGETEQYFKRLFSSANFAFLASNNEGCIEQAQQCLHYYKQQMKAGKEVKKELGQTENLLGKAYRRKGNQAEADAHYAAALTYEDNSEQKESSTEKFDRIIQETQSQLELTKKHFGQFAYAHSLATLAGCYAARQNYGQAVEHYTHYVDALREGIREQFRSLDEKDRMRLWSDQQFSLQELSELQTIIGQGESEQAAAINRAFYNVQLLRKGMLLNSAIEFEKVLNETGNTQLQRTYKDIRQKEQQLDSLRQTVASEAIVAQIVELQNQIAQQQNSLYAACSEYADYTQYIAYDWHDVQQKLGRDDVAIEFAVVGGPNDFLNKDKSIKALVLTKGMSAPLCVDLGKNGDLEPLLSSSEASVRAEAGQAIWGKLSTFLKGKKRVYFSADGILNRVGIEYLPLEGKPASEVYEIYRLSSTKELCMKHKTEKHTNIVLIGGLDYGTSTAQLTSEKRQRLQAMRGYRESDGGFETLPYAEAEITSLSTLYARKKPLVLTQGEATEKAFAQLDDKRVNLLHISTHGSWMGNTKSTDDEAMNNSILALSGANNGGTNTADDGIISAADIAQMNLRHCDLVVLSACQTGLGHQGDDGVFGLQRGFKNAGAHSLLVTLSSVYDESTAMLMEQFHKNLAHSDKRKALIQAQQYLRQHGFDDPKYWAVFILIDGVD